MLGCTAEVQLSSHRWVDRVGSKDMDQHHTRELRSQQPTPSTEEERLSPHMGWSSLLPRLMAQASLEIMQLSRVPR